MSAAWYLSFIFRKALHARDISIQRAPFHPELFGNATAMDPRMPWASILRVLKAGAGWPGRSRVKTPPPRLPI